MFCAKAFIYCFARLFLPMSSCKDAMISGCDRISYTLLHKLSIKQSFASTKTRACPFPDTQRFSAEAFSQW